MLLPSECLTHCISPEGLALHVLICQAMVGERLIPHGVAGVSQGLCAQLVGLWCGADRDKEMEISKLPSHKISHIICFITVGVYEVLLPIRSCFCNPGLPHSPLQLLDIIPVAALWILSIQTTRCQAWASRKASHHPMGSKKNHHLFFLSRILRW